MGQASSGGDMDDGKRFSAIKKLKCIRDRNHIVLEVRDSPYVIFVWCGKVYWDNVRTEETVSFEEAFDGLPEEAQVEILFNLELFK